MGAVATSLHVATVGSALLWPLAAGVAVVLWSKGRATRRAGTIAAVDDQLKGLYRTLEARPVPPEITLVVDALQEGDDLTPNAGAKNRAAASS